MSQIVTSHAIRLFASQTTISKAMYSIASHLPKDTSDYLDAEMPIPSFPLKKSPFQIKTNKATGQVFSNFVKEPLTKELMQKRYALLGKEKWREFIDGKDASYGKHAYDLGIHKEGFGDKEPGYLSSMTDACQYIYDHIDTLTCIDDYLKIHSIACAHFASSNADDFTICLKEEIGAFRTMRVGSLILPKRKISSDVIEELNNLDKRIGASFFVEKQGMHISISYRENANAADMQQKFTKLLNGYQRDIKRCVEPSQKLYVIARLYQHSQWLHTTTDGSGRLDIAVMNKNLTQNGFHPTILNYPYMCCTSTLADWVDALQDGLHLWESTALKVHGLITTA